MRQDSHGSRIIGNIQLAHKYAPTERPHFGITCVSGNSVNSVDGSITAIATGYASVEAQVRLSPDGSRRPGEQTGPIRQSMFAVSDARTR